MMRYDTHAHTWSAKDMPSAPHSQTRGTGACTADALCLVGGRARADPNKGCSVAWLSKAGGTWPL